MAILHVVPENDQVTHDLDKDDRAVCPGRRAWEAGQERQRAAAIAKRPCETCGEEPG